MVEGAREEARIVDLLVYSFRYHFLSVQFSNSHVYIYAWFGPLLFVQ